MCPSCRRGVVSGAWARRRQHNNPVMRLAGTIHKGVSCDHRRRLAASVGVAVVLVHGECLCSLETLTNL